VKKVSISDLAGYQNLGGSGRAFLGNIVAKDGRQVVMQVMVLDREVEANPVDRQGESGDCEAFR